MSRSKKIFKGIGQVGMIILIQKLFNLFSLVILARLLTPAEFGVMSAAIIVINFTTMFTSAGITTTLIQRETLSERDIRVAMALSLGVSLLLYIVIAGSSQLIAAFMHIDVLNQVVPVLATILIINGFSNITAALMQRDEKVFKLTYLQMITSVVSVLGVTIPLGYAGYGYWALVISEVVRNILAAIFTYRAQRHVIRPVWDKHIAKDLSNKGMGFFLSRFFSFISMQADYVIVGRYFGADMLGYYGRAYRLMDYPSTIYNTIVDRLVFPAMSRIQNEQERLLSTLMRGLALTSLISLPIAAFLALCSQELVIVLFGKKWAMTGDMLAVLGAFTFFRVSWKVFATYFRAQGKVKILMMQSFLYAAMVVAFTMYVAWYGTALDVAYAVSLAIMLNWFIILIRTMIYANIRIMTIIRLFSGSVLITLMVIAAILAVKYAMPVTTSALILVIAEMVASGIVIMAIYAARPAFLLGEHGLLLRDNIHGAVVKLGTKLRRK